jgi:hypothetical protein
MAPVGVATYVAPRRNGKGGTLRKGWLVVCCVAFSLALSGSAGATVSFGITEDTTAPIDATTFYADLNDLGATENRIQVLWDPARPTAIADQAGLDVWVPQAAIRGVRVIFAVAPAHPRDLTASPAAIGQFSAFLQLLATTYPSVKDFIIGNESNLSRFWQPQFNPNGTGASGFAYESLLAASYDALKAKDPSINVIGIGLSPRGNDNPRAKSNVSTSPVRFLHDIGVAYRASKRTKPLMNELAFHPYPNQNNDPPLKGYPWPNAGIPNLDRIKQAVWDAFNGTAQPTFGERGKPRPANALRLDLDETGWQVAIPSALQALYVGKESVTPVDERTQAQYYGDIIRTVTCDPDIRLLSFFHLIDERDLDRWQSGLLRIDGTRRPSYDAVKSAIAQTHGQCALTPLGWAHATSVIGGAVRFGYLSARSTRNKIWRFRALAQEEATYRAAIFRVGKGKLTPTARRAVLRALASGRSRPLLAARGIVKAYSSKLVKLQKKGLKRGGWYVYGIRLGAAMNPQQRSLTAVSKPFRVVAPPRPRR